MTMPPGPPGPDRPTYHEGGWVGPPGAPIYPTGYQPYDPPPPPRRRRHWIRWTLAGLGLLLAVGVGAGIAEGNPAQGRHLAAASACPSHWVKVGTNGACAPGPADSPTATQLPPAPTPSPDGTTSGTCDVSLADSLYGQNWLTATVTADNTGNIGERVRVRVSWPLQGFAPLTRVKTVRLGIGASKDVEFRVPVSESQVSQFQDEQLAASDGDPCHYHGAIVGTFGQPQG